jgi:hypothetical protein
MLHRRDSLSLVLNHPGRGRCDGVAFSHCGVGILNLVEQVYLVIFWLGGRVSRRLLLLSWWLGLDSDSVQVMAMRADLLIRDCLNNVRLAWIHVFWAAVSWTAACQIGLSRATFVIARLRTCSYLERCYSITTNPSYPSELVKRPLL